MCFWCLKLDNNKTVLLQRNVTELPTSNAVLDYQSICDTHRNKNYKKCSVAITKRVFDIQERYKFNFTEYEIFRFKNLVCCVYI